MSNPIGIIGAMDIEVNGIIESMDSFEKERISGIDFYSGNLYGRNIVVAKCGIGKVFASICTQAMILKFSPTAIINTGIAGSLTKDLGVLDVAIAKSVVQHDMDTSPLGDPKGLISGINIVYFNSDKRIAEGLKNAAEEAKSKAMYGTIATGDKFVSLESDKKEIRTLFDAVACEMEGASVGHTCYVNNVPFGVIRTISDGEGAEMDYATFAEKAAKQSVKIIKNFIKNLSEEK